MNVGDKTLSMLESQNTTKVTSITMKDLDYKQRDYRLSFPTNMALEKEHEALVESADQPNSGRGLPAR